MTYNHQIEVQYNKPKSNPKRGRSVSLRIILSKQTDRLYLVIQALEPGPTATLLDYQKTKRTQRRPRVPTEGPNVSLGIKKQNEPNVGQASLLDFKYYKTKPNILIFNRKSRIARKTKPNQTQNMGESRCISERFVWRFTKRTQNP
jgi:hypothetical protein